MAFTHLHVHTEYSILDGSCKIKELVARARELGMDSLAITDHGVMYGVIDFYKAAKAEGIRPIIGCEVYVAPGSRHDREKGTGTDRYNHLVLLAENNAGYSNLMKIVSYGFIDGYYYRPRVDMDILGQYHEGIIALSACLAGEIPRKILQDRYDDAKAAAQKYLDVFGAGNYFLELQDHGIPEQKKVNMALLRMSGELGIPLVATNDVHYINATDAEAHDVLLCIQTGKKVSDDNRMRYDGGQYYLKSEEQMRELFSYVPQAIQNTGEIAKRCNVTIEFGQRKLPSFDVPDGGSAEEYLRKLCLEGLAKRYPKDDGTCLERLEHELSVIADMGFSDYFLIVWDFIRYAKTNDIATGPGRGSAAGSIVSYCLEITDIDPIKYHLLFERFLNPERVSMPDIDIDFCFERRGEVINYVTEKYGRDRVVQIVTFGTMAARGVIRDVGRAMDFPYAFCDRIAKMVPKELNITIKKALETSPDLRRAYAADPDVKTLVDMAMCLEGLPRNTSMHAAGVVICGRPAMEYVPLSRAADSQLTTQYTMTALEELGLLKMDFLGLRTLTVIEKCIDLVGEKIKKRLNMSSIDYADRKVFDYIGTGQDEGIFQLESAGMKSFMKELKPHSIEDLTAGIALYRPGPMDFIPQYIKGKADPHKVRYLCPQIRPILRPTYGCIVYQEQVMQIVRDLAGFPLGRSDVLRRAMSKKKEDVMARERENFVNGNARLGIAGCVANGISQEVANTIYDEMTDFAKYAFNKSHAVCYAVVSYRTAYLKYYYPVEYMAALMTSVITFSEKVASYVNVCRRMGINILPPDINDGGGDFTVSGHNIRYGLSAIRNIGENLIEVIVGQRTANGPYAGLKDFLKRTGEDLNKRAVENLIKAGAMDCLGLNRRQMMIAFPYILDEISKDRKSNVEGQLSLFDIPGSEKMKIRQEIPDIGEYPDAERLAYEKEVMGFYISGHPLEDYRERWDTNITARGADFVINPETGDAAVKDGQFCIIGGVIAAITTKITKNSQMMAFVTLEDLTGEIEIIFFPRDYENYRDILQQDAKVFVRGRVSLTDEKGKLIAERALPFEPWPQAVWVQFEDMESFLASKTRLLKIMGGIQVNIYIKKEKRLLQSRAVRNGELEEEGYMELCEAFGGKNVAKKDKTLKDIGIFRGGI